MARLIASFFGTGLILRQIRGADIGSGTVGGFVAAIVGFWISQAGGWWWVPLAAVLVGVAGTVAIRRLYAESGDAGWIVVDEATGALIALIGITALPAAVASFAVFRLADIFKQFFPGVDRAERLPGAAGVMADDVVAGLYGLLAGQIVSRLV